jgi:putative pre-16S rRNA nuclease
MSRIMAIDYGRKRVGIAVTDENRIIATALTTVHAKDVFDFLTEYFNNEDVETVVVGEPKNWKDEDSDAAQFINPFVKKLKKTFPSLKIERHDESYTSKMAFETLISAGIKKKKRREKALLDKISATIILQSYMEANS